LREHDLLTIPVANYAQMNTIFTHAHVPLKKMYNSRLTIMAINHLADNKTDYTSYAAMKARDSEEGQAEDLAWQALHLVFLLSFSGTLV
jgi:hypothetical protein